VPSYESSLRNLARARASRHWHAPRPWRSKEESELIRRFVWLWFTCRDRSRPSARSWAKQLGISHTWIQRIVKRFVRKPDEMHRIGARGEPQYSDLLRARERTEYMRVCGQLRPSRRA
jgi:hypothetical protein